MEQSNASDSTLVWSTLGAITSLLCLVGSALVLPGLEWTQVKWGTITICGTGPLPAVPIRTPGIEWHLTLYGKTIYTHLDEQIPFQLPLLKIIIPALSAISLLMFVVIYRRCYRAQFR
jgi:hypothetical protein